MASAMARNVSAAISRLPVRSMAPAMPHMDGPSGVRSSLPNRQSFLRAKEGFGAALCNDAPAHSAEAEKSSLAAQRRGALLRRKRQSRLLLRHLLENNHMLPRQMVKRLLILHV